MAELCPAFLIADFEDAARDAGRAVARLYALVASRSSTATPNEPIEIARLGAWLEQQPEWRDAQSAVQRQFRARAAVEQTGLPLPAEAAVAAERAQYDFARLGTALSRRMSQSVTRNH